MESNVSDTVVTSLKVSYEDTTNFSKVSNKRYRDNITKNVQWSQTDAGWDR